MGLTKFSAGVNALTTRHRMMILAVSFSGMLLLMLSKSFLKLMKSRRSGDLNSARCSTMIRTSSLMWSIQEDRERKFVGQVFKVCLDKFQGYFSYHLRDSRKFANIFSCVVVKSYVFLWNVNDRSFPPFVGEDLRFPGFTNEWEQQFCRDSGSYKK